ncbi:hypothetical protein PCANC_15748 [Puccinia coronata f. sp. avenae]|nr:hypothetical protein PCANC_15748 [Puccinia coronata f. sp. avenae]
MATCAFVTVLTSDSYLPGSLVTAYSIKENEEASTRKHDLVCLVTLDSVSVQSIKALRQIYDLVISVEEIRSGNSENELNLLGRQDLSYTVTKIHIWRLTQYEKVIYLDSDTLLLRAISHLFQLASPFSACPDIGWPDCFNSGLMVISPNEQTFEKLFKHFLSQGSWDGADQGLLNDYFAEPSGGDPPPGGSDVQSHGWNRLSFIYNVTPSAYYTYAPAYKRYGDKIAMIHFIGRDKPWHLINRRRYRNAYAPNHQSEHLNAVDYDSLVDRWLDAYEKVVGPIEPLEWSTFQPEFSVPKYASQWDSLQPSAYQPPSLEELKETFSRRQADYGSQFYNPKASQNEGGYMSLPFLNLSGKARDSILEKQGMVTTASDSARDGQSRQDETQNDYQDSDKVWDPSQSSLPIGGGYQMNEPITKHYEAAWDKPLSEQSRNFFQPPPVTHSIPSITHQDYSRFSSAPEPNAVQAVFPWEENARHNIGRVFPHEGNRTSASHSSHHEDHHQHDVQVSQPSLSQIYRNAWDEDPMIGRWAQARSVSGSHRNPNAGWKKSQATKAALIQTPRLEIRGFDFDVTDTKGKESSRESENVGRIPTSHHHHQQQQHHHHHHPSRSMTFSSSSYRSERDCEENSQDADEEDVGEDEDQASDIRIVIEDVCSESTITIPSDTSPNPNATPATDATKMPEINRADSLGTSSRLPTNRTMIVGIPVQMLRTSSSSSNSSAQSWESENKNSLARRATRLMG